MQHSSEVNKVVFSPDDRLALTVCGDGSARLWEVGCCKLISRPLQYEIGTGGAVMKINDGVFNFDGSAVVFQCDDGSVRLYNVPVQLPADSRLVQAWALAHCAFESDNNANLRRLSTAQWLSAQNELRELQPQE